MLGSTSTTGVAILSSSSVSSSILVPDLALLGEQGEVVDPGELIRISSREFLYGDYALGEITLRVILINLGADSVSDLGLTGLPIATQPSPKPLGTTNTRQATTHNLAWTDRAASAETWR